MKFLKLVRAFKDGVKNLFRNKWLTLATVFILTLSLYVIGGTIFLGITGRMIVSKIESNMEINVYLNPGVTQEDALALKSMIEPTAEVTSVEYVSNEDALKKFMTDSGNDPAILEAINEIGENPLLSYLIVRADDPNHFASIASVLEGDKFKDKVNHVNYEKNKDKINRLGGITGIIEKIGMTLGTIFVVVAILITFNTIRLNMYSRKKEFEIMRLVGASNMYVQMPSIFEGMFYGFISSALAMILVFASARSIVPLTQGVASQQMLMSFYWQNFWMILLGMLVLGVAIGVISSFIAIRRYLKI